MVHKSKIEKICVVGLGYIGLPTSAILSNSAFEVVGVDINSELLNKIEKYGTHFQEKGLNKLVKKSLKSGTLKLARRPEASDVFFITVPTPYKGKTKKPDLSHVYNAIDSIIPFLVSGNLIILESTCPVGTTRLIGEYIERNSKFKSAECIHICYCPERVLPGNIIRELIYNDRIIGGLTEKAGKLALKVFKKFLKGKCILASSPEVAEMSKLAENTFRDINIAFANELSVICENSDVDIWELIKLANLHPRVNILQPGAGVGGHCISIDPWFLISDNRNNCHLMKAARKVNDTKPEYIISQVKKIAERNKTKRIVCLGLTYKPDVDDLRESPSLYIYQRLKHFYGDRVIAVDPYLIKKNIEGINFESHSNVVLNDAIVLPLVGHKHFKDLRFKSQLTIDPIGLFNNF